MAIIVVLQVGEKEKMPIKTIIDELIFDESSCWQIRESERTKKSVCLAYL